MRAYVVNGDAQLQDVPDPLPPQGEALVRVLAAGVCNTDLEILKGYMGFSGVLGHEFVGEVVQAENEHLVGKRVVGEINCVCGQCRYCRLEMPHHCLDRTVLGILNRDGAFAEYLTLPEANLHVIPDPLRTDSAVFTEPVAAAFRITEQVSLTPEDSVVVLGDGKLGQLIAQVLTLSTKKVTCVGKHASKLERVQQAGIATAMLDDSIEEGADVVVEATGSPAGFQRALEIVRPEGTVVLKTTVAGNTELDFSVPVINEVRVVGSRCGPFRPAIEALALGTVDVAPLISHTFPLDEIDEAIEAARQPDCLKVLLTMP
jgi:2-desacetyl-2-hydroxyethyl bacteriochlorophyllide A dehydrogenase